MRLAKLFVEGSPMATRLLNPGFPWLVRVVGLTILAWQSGGAFAQNSAFRPALSAWPVYQASRAMTVPYYPSNQSTYRAPAYSSPQNWQNPWAGAEIHGLWH